MIKIKLGERESGEKEKARWDPNINKLISLVETAQVVSWGLQEKAISTIKFWS